MRTFVTKTVLYTAALLLALAFYFRLEIIHRGGLVMVPILLCSFGALAIVIERGMCLWRAKVDTRSIMNTVSQSIKRNRIVEALETCERTPGPVAQILKSGLLKHDRSRQEVKEAIEDAANNEIPRLEHNLNILATIGHIAPLLGLLGTVTGLVRAFQVVQMKSTALNPVSPGDLAGGIWEALITTVAGLLVAIPTLFMYHYFVNWVNTFVLEMEHSATQLVNLLSERSEREISKTR